MLRRVYEASEDDLRRLRHDGSVVAVYLTEINLIPFLDVFSIHISFRVGLDILIN